MPIFGQNQRMNALAEQLRKRRRCPDYLIICRTNIDYRSQGQPKHGFLTLADPLLSFEVVNSIKFSINAFFSIVSSPFLQVISSFKTQRIKPVLRDLTGCFHFFISKTNPQDAHLRKTRIRGHGTSRSVAQKQRLRLKTCIGHKTINHPTSSTHLIKQPNSVQTRGKPLLQQKRPLQKSSLFNNTFIRQTKHIIEKTAEVALILQLYFIDQTSYLSNQNNGRIFRPFRR